MSGDNEDKKKCVFCAQETLEKIIYFTPETLKKSWKLEMVWFTGNQLPEAYEDIVVTPEILGNTSESDTQDMDENDQSDLNFQFDEDSTDDEN
ncbi:hypothetical protein HHI36_016051 [Cryptolaemus montrouzieri]|uniref:Uncharacterized protein n=1 Tax=Cryptolaemus montrouzieri TaxID=559131 RepID=A0ABD2N7H4_9CUCU